MEQRILDLSKPVKFINPQNEEEAKIIFWVANYNEVTNRVYIQPLNLDLALPGQELVSVEDIKNVENEIKNKGVEDVAI
jgi:hypothetical protein